MHVKNQRIQNDWIPLPFSLLSISDSDVNPLLLLWAASVFPLSGTALVFHVCWQPLTCSGLLTQLSYTHLGSFVKPLLSLLKLFSVSICPSVCLSVSVFLLLVIIKLFANKSHPAPIPHLSIFCVCACVCEDWRPTLGGFLNCFPLYFVRQGLSLNLELTDLPTLAG